MADLARLAGVHASTVSRALAGSPLVEAGKREQILRLARERGYVINTVARNLRLKRTQTLTVAIPLQHEASQPLTDPFFVEMLGHLAEAITQRGYGMFLQKFVPPMGDWLQNLIGSGRFDGIIVIGQSTEHQVLQKVASTYLPLVVWGGHLKGQSYCSVGTDNAGGALAAVEHLLNTGRRHILFLGDPTVPEIRLRHEGYKMALSRAPRGTGAPRLVPAHLTADAAYAGHVTLGWMDNWLYAQNAPTSPWRGAMAFPRRVSLRFQGGMYHLIQRPITELAKLRDKHRQLADFTTPHGRTLLSVPAEGGAHEIRALVRVGRRGTFALIIGSSNGRVVQLGYDAAMDRFSVSRQGLYRFSNAFDSRDASTLSSMNGVISLDVIIDRSSVEAYVNDGELTVAERMFPDGGAYTVTVNSSRARIERMDLWSLRSIWTPESRPTSARAHARSERRAGSG